MPTLTPNASLTLDPQPLPDVRVGAYALLLRPAGASAPYVRLALLQGRHGSRLTVNGAPTDTHARASLAPGALVGARVAQADVSAVLPQRQLALELLLALFDADARAWLTAASWELGVDLVAPRVTASARRDPQGRVLLTVLSDAEDTVLARATSSARVALTGVTSDNTSATSDTTAVTSDGHDASGAHLASTSSVTRTWQGDRDGFSGAKAFTLILPADAQAITASVEDAAGNRSSVSVPTPPLPPEPPPNQVAWALPPWLADRGTTAPLLAAAAAVSASAAEAPAQLDPTSASRAYLDEHARTYGVERYPGERDAQLRERALALPLGKHLSRASLESHLSSVAGARVQIADAGAGLSDGWVRLAGTHQLDGSWDLGGPGADLAPGYYLVRLEEAPRAPLPRMLDELARLRPVGITPVVTLARARTTRLGVLVGNRTFDPPDAVAQPNAWDFGTIVSPSSDADFGSVEAPAGDEDFEEL